MAAGQSTALQLVNGVLRRLGKSQVTDFTGATGDTWGGLVRDSLNEGMREIEKEHDWSTLITSGTFSTSSRTYDLSASFSNFGREVNLADTDNNVVLQPKSLMELDLYDPGQDYTGAPLAYSIQYPNLLFSSTPSAVNYRLRYVKRPTALTTVGTLSELPEYCDITLIWWVVWQMQASREDAQDRGESSRDIYEKSLARAIGQDRRRMDRVYRLGSLFPSWPSGRRPVNLGSHYEPV